MQEIWKDIEGYGGKYQVSNLGNVRSFAVDKKAGKLLGQRLNHKGYPVVYLHDGKPKTCVVHRLVAKAFIPNPNNLPQVNHKDEDKTNNRVNNLEWCTNDYNIHYGTAIERARQSNMCCKTTSVGVFSVDPDGNFRFYDSIGDAERKTGNSHCNIVRALKGRRPRCGGVYWFYSYEPRRQAAYND